MTGSMHDGKLYIPNLEPLAVGEFAVWRRRLFELQTINLGLPTSRFVQSAVERMEINGHVPSLLDRCNGADVIDVHRPSRSTIHHQVAVFLKGSDGECLHVHHYFFFPRICVQTTSVTQFLSNGSRN